jgi:hypothetical protein
MVMKGHPGRRRPDASRYLLEEWGVSCAPTTLATLAARGEGPEYSLRGRYAVYQDAALDKFAKTRITAPKRRKRRTAPKAPAEAEARVA